MANNFEGGGLVSDIISPQVYKQIADLIADLASANEAIGRVSATAKTVEFQFKGAETLTQLSALIKDATAATNGLAAAQKSYIDTAANLSATQADLAQKLGSTNQQVVTLQATVNAATQAIKANDAATVTAVQGVLKTASANNAMSMSLQELSAKLAAKKAKLEEVNSALEFYTKSLKEGQGDLAVTSEMVQKFTLRQMELKQEISATTSAIKTEIKENYAAIGSIDEKAQALFQLKERYRALSAAERENAEIGGVLNKEIQELDTEVKALNASIGNFQGFVGNYERGFKSVGAELAAVRGEMQRMVLAGEEASAEYKALEVQAIELAAAQREVSVSTGRQTFSVENLTKRLETMGFRMLVHMAIFQLVIEGATKLYEWWTKDARAAEEFEDATKKLGATAQQNAINEMANAKVLASVAQDVNQSMAIRLRAVDDLQSKYPDYLGNLSKEAILTGDTADAMDRLNVAMMNKAFAEAALGKVGELAKKFIELNDQMKELEKENPTRQGVGKDLIITGQQSQSGNKEKEEQQKLFNERKAVRQAEIDDVKKKMQEYQDEANKFASLAGGLFVSNASKGKNKGTTGTDLKGNNDLANAQFELAKQLLAQDMENQKAIYESTKYGLDKRKEALRAYYDDEIELARITMVKEIAINDNIIAEDIKKLNTQKNLSDAAKKGLQESIDAAGIRNVAATEKYGASINAATRKFGEQNVSIEKSNTDYELNQIKQRGNAKILAATESFANEVFALRQQLDKKEITQSEYNEKEKQIELKHKREILEIDIATDEEQLKNMSISAEQKLAILKDLQAKKEQLAASGANKGKANQFEGDVVGGLYNEAFKSIAPDASEDERVKAAKRASQLTTQLAQETANAIVAIEENKFKKIQEDLDRQGQQIQLNKSREIDAVNATADYADSKAAKIKEINAKAAAQENELAQKKKEENIKAARFEKAANIARILSATAVAEVQALSYLSNIATAPIYPVIAGLIGAIGAAQLAAAASAPLPAYRHGTDYHKGGLAIVGDGGERELINEPNKAPYWSGSKSEVRNLAKGTKVTPESQLMRYAEANINNYIFAGTDAPSGNKENDYSHVFKKGLKGVEQVVGSIKPHVTVIVQSNDTYNKLKYE